MIIKRRTIESPDPQPSLVPFFFLVLLFDFAALLQILHNTSLGFDFNNYLREALSGLLLAFPSNLPEKINCICLANSPSADAFKSYI